MTYTPRVCLPVVVSLLATKRPPHEFVSYCCCRCCFAHYFVAHGKNTIVLTVLYVYFAPGYILLPSTEGIFDIWNYLGPLYEWTYVRVYVLVSAQSKATKHLPVLCLHANNKERHPRRFPHSTLQLVTLSGSWYDYFTVSSIIDPHLTTVLQTREAIKPTQYDRRVQLTFVTPRVGNDASNYLQRLGVLY